MGTACATLGDGDAVLVGQDVSAPGRGGEGACLPCEDEGVSSARPAPAGQQIIPDPGKEPGRASRSRERTREGARPPREPSALPLAGACPDLGSAALLGSGQCDRGHRVRPGVRRSGTSAFPSCGQGGSLLAVGL